MSLLPPIVPLLYEPQDPQMRANLQQLWTLLGLTINTNASTMTVLEDTHANRLSNYGASSYSLGTEFWETDRTVFYMVATVAGANAWIYTAGIYRAVFANRPSDLGATDTGFRFVATDTAQHFRWTGSAWLEEYQVNDAGTNTILALLNLIHRSSGTPAAGFGASLSYQLDSSAKNVRKAGVAEVLWTTATDASESADYVVTLMAGGAAAAEKFRVTSAGQAKASSASWSTTDAGTNTVDLLDTVAHLSSGTPSAGFGAGFSVQLHSSANNLRSAGDLDIVWSTATDASESADFVVRLMSGGSAAAEAFRIVAGGAMKMQGKLVLYNNATPTDGQLLIGNTAGNRFDAATLTGTANEIIVTNAGGSITLSTPQAIGTGSSPTFNVLTLTELIDPLIVGGSGAASTLTLESTSGAGTSDSIIMKTGSQVTALTLDTNQAAILNNGSLSVRGTNGFGIGSNTVNSGRFRMDVGGSSGQEYRFVNTSNSLTGITVPTIGASGALAFNTNGTTNAALFDTSQIFNYGTRTAASVPGNFAANFLFHIKSLSGLDMFVPAMSAAW